MGAAAVEDVLFPGIDVRVTAVHATEERVVVEASSCGQPPACPDCGWLGRRVHSRYVRRVAERPPVGRALVIWLSELFQRCRSRVRTAAAIDDNGTNAQLRTALSERGLAYVLAVRSDVSAHPYEAKPVAPARNGATGCWPQPRYRQAAPSVAALAAGLRQEAFTPLTWRHGSRGEFRSRFAAVRVRPAGKAVERPIKAAASAEQGWWDGILPDCWLLIEWPADADAPTDYWLSNLPADTPVADLVRLAKVRWRIEHDYRELKHGLGLDHFEGRSWPGWHHHVTLVNAAHAFLTEQRLAPKCPDRSHPLPSPRRPPGRPEVLDRRLHHLPPNPAHQDTHDTKIEKDLTESY